MAEIGSSYSLGHRLDIKQILLEAQHRWLRPAEICEILRCYENFKLSPQPPNKPFSGSFFFFDRKVLRYYRKDGHNWRKRKDEKTVRETHEKLKVGSVDMLHCFYAHAEDNENFHRRSYWLLEKDLMHIVFVHYLEVKGNKTHGSYVRNIESQTSCSENGMSFRGTSPTSMLKPSYEDCSFHPNSITVNQNLMFDLVHVPGSKLFEKSLLPNQKKHMEHSYICRDEHKVQSEQINLQKPISDAEFGNAKNSNLDNVGSILGNRSYSFSLKMPMMSGLQAEESLKKVDSFTRGFDNELGEADELQMKPTTTGSSRSLVRGEDDSNMPGQLQKYVEIPNSSISQDQLFSIFEFWPNWAYSNSETKVFIAGTFLKSEQELAKYRWSIMFGEVEVPAEVLADGFLCCYVPPHNPGLIPFYVTSSNRLACSEIREFEFRFRTDQNTDVSGHNASPATV